jgi:multidrug efflux pump subunit AcrA (membrane-fusion protein)
VKKKILFFVIPAIIIVAVFIVFQQKGSDDDEFEVLVEATVGEFRIEVTTTGELEAKNSVTIPGPTGLRRAQIWQVKIEHLVEEGTTVEKGDYIARLDPSELMDKIQKATTDLQQSQSQYTQTRLDTALELRKSRDELINMEFDVQQKQIVLEQSKFEPPATIKQNEIELQKTKRSLSQATEGYKLKTEKAVAQMQEAAAKVTEHRVNLNFYESLLKEFTITAPEPGMVIYKRSWNGTKIETGSTVEPWDPTVATLPDLSVMVSKTYVNEVDISTVDVGQPVKLSLDAFPDKKLTGKVIEIANVGEQKPNSDSKVFQVLIEINESDTTLRPGMTTGNTIIADVEENVVFVPLECLHSQGDSISFVIKKAGFGKFKQEVNISKTNADEAVIDAGVTEGDILYLSDPGGIDKEQIKLLESSKEALNTKDQETNK